MNSLEEYIQNLLFQEDCESAMDDIINRMFESEDSDNETVDPANISNTGSYFMFDPFPFLLFNKDGTLISDKVVSYCEQALRDYNKNKDNYKTLCFIPPFIKDQMQITIFSEITRAFIRSEAANGIPRINILRDFYNLLSSNKIASGKPNDEYVFTNFRSWNAFAPEARKPTNHVFTFTDFGNKQYDELKNAVRAQGIYINYENTVVPTMSLVSSLAKQFNIKKGSISDDSKEKETPYKKYLSYLIACCATDVDATEASALAVRSGKAAKIDSKKISGFNSEYDKGTYKGSKLDAYKGGLKYWKDGELGDFVKDSNEHSPAGESDSWKSTLDNLKHTFDQDTVNDDLEKIYNLDKLGKDVMKGELDNKHYDARKYEDPDRSKVEGVAGHDIYKKDLRTKELELEIKDLKRQIVHEHDDDKVAELEKKIRAAEDEINHINSLRNKDDNEDHNLENEYKHKVQNAKTSKKTTDSDISKAVNFIEDFGLNEIDQLSILLKAN